MKPLHWLLRPEGPTPSLAMSVALLLLIAISDDLTGKQLSLGACYLLPVMLATWQGGRAWGLALSFGSIALLVAVAFHVGNPFSRMTYLYGYFGAILLMLVIVTEAIAQLRGAFDQKTGK